MFQIFPLSVVCLLSVSDQCVMMMDDVMSLTDFLSVSVSVRFIHPNSHTYSKRPTTKQKVHGAHARRNTSEIWIILTHYLTQEQALCKVYGQAFLFLAGVICQIFVTRK